MTEAVWISKVFCGHRVFKVSTIEERPERSAETGPMKTIVWELFGEDYIPSNMEKLTMVPGGPEVHHAICLELMAHATIPDIYQTKADP
jgi:hypothetical protein